MEIINRTWIVIKLVIFLSIIGCAFTDGAVFLQIEPLDMRVNVGETATLFCLVQQLNAGQTLGWVRDHERIAKNNVILDSALRHFTLRLDNYGYILAINKTRLSDANRYACAVYEADDENTPILISRFAEVGVWQKPGEQYPECSSEAKEYRFAQGSQVILNCLAEFLTPQVTLQWFYNGEPVEFATINTNNDDETFVQSRLSFEASKQYHLAEFECRLTTEFDLGILQTCTAGPLEIDYRPTVHIDPVYATAGELVTIFCNSTGNPEPFIHTWHFSPDIEQERYEIDETDSYLHLYSPRTRLNGTTVECIAYNSAGYGKGETILIVQGIDPPEDEFDIFGKVTPIQSGNNNEQYTSIETNTVAIIFLIVGIFSVVIVFFAVIPICFRPACREVVDASGHKIPQPDVYFEPKDRVLPPVPSEEQYASWRRSVAVQVSDTGGDLDSTYAEVMEEIEDKELSIIYSRKSIYI